MPGRRLGLDTTLLRSFAAVAGARSFTRAAALVGRTQPAVTLQIARLESLLGTKLLTRTSREATLTPAGAALLPVAREVLGLLDSVPAGLGAAAEAGDLRFGSPEDFATLYLPDILARFVETHPRVHLTTHCEPTVRLVEGMREGAYDLAVIKQDPQALPPGARPLWWREKLVWAAGSEVARPSTAGPLSLVLSPEPCVYRSAAIRALEAAGRPWRVVYTSPSLVGAALHLK